MKIFAKRVLLFTFVVCFFAVHSEKIFASKGEYGRPKLGIGIPVSVQIDEFYFKWWLNDNITIEPLFGFGMVSVNDDKGYNWELGLEVAPRWGNEKLVKFIGVGYAMNILKSGSETYTDKLLGIEFGLEYFVKEKLSVVGIVGGNFVFADDGYSPYGSIPGSTTFNTASSLIVYLYF
ncbi:MAG: hypothetical protein P8Y62_10650 [candidate division WOR-3 bacterium]|jgi:hypothetical protein